MSLYHSSCFAADVGLCLPAGVPTLRAEEAQCVLSRWTGPSLRDVKHAYRKYTLTFVEGHHQTGFGFWIWRYDPSFPKRNIVDPTQGIIPAEQIRFESMAGDSFAD